MKKKRSKDKDQKNIDGFHPIFLDKISNLKNQNKVSFEFSESEEEPEESKNPTDFKKSTNFLNLKESEGFFSGYSELTRLLIFVIFLSLAGYIFYVLVFERSIQGKIMRFVASVVPED